MILHPPTITIPLQTDENGIIRVSGTRIPLDTVIARHRQGDSPEVIHESFDVLPLNDIYAVLAYYLAHQDGINQYIREREAKAEQVRHEAEANSTTKQRLHHERLRKLVDEKLHSSSE